MNKALLTLVLAIASAPCAWGQAEAENAHFILRAPAQEALIGSRIELSGEIHLSDTAQAACPQGRLPETWAVLECRVGAASGGKRPFQLAAMAFALGEQTFPELEWAVSGDDDAPASIKSPSLRITVTPPPPGPRDAGDIRDIKGPYEPRRWPWILAAASLVFGILFLLWRWLRPVAKEEPAPAEPVDERTAEEIALADIDALYGQGLPVKDFYDRLSDIVRLYLERRFKIHALQRTTYELQREMLAAGLDAAGRALMKNLLARCDLAKFARYQPADGDLIKDCENAKQVVRAFSPDRLVDNTVGDLAGGGR